MGLFDVFKKKECCICGDEVGLIGNRKLEDGNMCSKCAKKLSPWFEDRRSSTVQQIKEQLAYREANARELETFQVTRTIGDAYKIYIEEVNGVPTRFFVTNSRDYKAANPDIISFRDVISCVTDIRVRDEEMKQKDAEGKMVSYSPPRFKHHHEFYIKMEIRNNPYFDDISFYVNSGTVTLETVGGVGGGIGGAAMAGLLKGAGISTAGVQTNSLRNSSEHRRYEEYRMMCQKIEQAVADGKRGGQSCGAADPVQNLLEQIRNAPDPETAMKLCTNAAMMAVNSPNQEAVKNQMAQALNEAQMRFAMASVSQPAAQPAAQSAVQSGPKFCPNCGAPAAGGKFCESCGSKLI